MENQETLNEITEEKKNSKWKQLVKKFGVWGIVFFTVKGIITTTLGLYLGNNLWSVIKTYFTTVFD
ncbi:hypothetical protein [Chryseobacterium sp.]|uniref:hypothetical protein n=1 Tax=Chryseobacterium sp. TaxID=1871047 RepID=UPI002FC5A57A